MVSRGWRNELGCNFESVGVDGTYWTASVIGGERDYVYAMNFYFTDSVENYYAFCSAEVPRATGNSVRCCKE